MFKWFRLAAAGCLLLVCLTGCAAGSPPADPAAIDVTVTTEPAAAAGQTVALLAAVTGAEASAVRNLTFDIRLQDNPKLVEAEPKKEGGFAGEFVFPQAGEYDVYVHFYVGDLHVTKKKQVVVQ